MKFPIFILFIMGLMIFSLFVPSTTEERTYYDAYGNQQRAYNLDTVVTLTYHKPIPYYNERYAFIVISVLIISMCIIGVEIK